ncbi:hypothetical protein Tco_0216887 [Tanacetum coccineum]
MSSHNQHGKPVTCCGCEGPLNGGFCSFCASRAGNSFAYDPNPNSFDDSQNLSDYPPQPQYQTYSYELCGNDAHFGYDCPPQVPFVYNPDPCFNQNYDNNFPQTSSSFPQQYLCCENCGGPHETFQCQPMNQNFYNSSGFDQFQPPQYPVIHHPPQETSKEILQAREDLMKSIQTFLKKFNRISFRETPKGGDINSPSWNRPAFYDDDDDDEYTIQYREYLENSSNAIIPVLPIEEPDNSLSMGDEHLSTILETESDEVTKSSVEDLVPIPSESKGISNDTCDVHFCDNSPPLDVLNDHFKIFSYFNNDCNSSDDDSFEDIDYIEASPLDSELVSLKEVKDDILYEKLLNINLLIACDLPSSDDFSPINNVKIYSNPLFDEPPLEENDDLFDLGSKTNEWKKILYDAPIDDVIFDPGGDIDEIDTFLDVDISTDIEDGYHDSEGDILYLESLLSDNPTLSLPPKVFLDHDPRSLSDINDLKIMVKVFDPEIHEIFFLQHMEVYPLRITIIFPSHMLSELFFLISLIR